MFTWKNRTSDSMGLIVEKMPEITRPQEKVEEIEIEGKDGHLTISSGKYEGLTKECIVHYVGSNFDELLNWLDGSGEVIFSNLPDRFYHARIENVIPLEQILHNNLYYFPIMFRTQPFGYRLDGRDTITITNNNHVLKNLGTIDAEPIITIFGTGDINFSIINGQEEQQIILKDVVDKVTVNTKQLQCYKDLQNKNSSMIGKFPKLRKGNNTINFTGSVTKVEIIPNWRYLI